MQIECYLHNLRIYVMQNNTRQYSLSTYHYHYQHQTNLCVYLDIMENFSVKFFNKKII